MVPLKVVLWTLVLQILWVVNKVQVGFQYCYCFWVILAPVIIPILRYVTTINSLVQDRFKEHHCFPVLSNRTYCFMNRNQHISRKEMFLWPVKNMWLRSISIRVNPSSHVSFSLFPFFMDLTVNAIKLSSPLRKWVWVGNTQNIPVRLL